MLAQILRKNVNKVSPNTLRRLVNLYPPFIGAGIRVVEIAEGYKRIEVRMKLRWYNMNYVGTQFGGSMYAMTDPFYMMMLINILGKNYIVWDKGACINFLKPGRGTVSVIFELNNEQITHIKQQADLHEKYIFDLPVEIRDEQETLIAEVNKTIYVRKKAQKLP